MRGTLKRKRVEETVSQIAKTSRRAEQEDSIEEFSSADEAIFDPRSHLSPIIFIGNGVNGNDSIEYTSEEDRPFSTAKKSALFNGEDPKDLICSFSDDNWDCKDSDCDSSSDIEVKEKKYSQDHETPYTSGEEENYRNSEIDRLTSSEENPALSKDNSPLSVDSLASSVVGLPEKQSSLPNLLQSRSLVFDKTQKSLITMFFPTEKSAGKEFFSADESTGKCELTLQNAL